MLIEGAGVDRGRRAPEGEPRLEGRNMSVIVVPTKTARRRKSEAQRTARAAREKEKNAEDEDQAGSRQAVHGHRRGRMKRKQGVPPPPCCRAKTRKQKRRLGKTGDGRSVRRAQQSAPHAARTADASTEESTTMPRVTRGTKGQPPPQEDPELCEGLRRRRGTVSPGPRDGRERTHVRVPRPQGAQARVPRAVDRAHQRRGARGGPELRDADARPQAGRRRDRSQGAGRARRERARRVRRSWSAREVASSLPESHGPAWARLEDDLARRRAPTPRARRQRRRSRASSRGCGSRTSARRAS